MRKMQRKAMKSLETSDRRSRVCQMYLDRKSQGEIAKELGVSTSTVGKDLAIIKEEWKAKRVMDMDDAKAEELERIDAIERRAIDEYERSRADEVTLETETSRNPHYPAEQDEENDTSRRRPPPVMRVRETKEKRTVKQRVGAAKFLEIMCWCVEMRCKILGLSKGIQQSNLSNQIDWAGFIAHQTHVHVHIDPAEERIRTLEALPVKESREVEVIDAPRLHQPKEVDQTDEHTNTGRVVEAVDRSGGERTQGGDGGDTGGGDQKDTEADKGEGEK